MTRDNDLIVSCPCGRVEVVMKDGYHEHDLTEVAEVGRAASLLCRHGKLWRVARWVVVVLIVLAASAGVVGTGVVEQGRIMSHQEAEQWSWKAEKCLKDEDYKGAVEAYTQAIALHPTVRSYLSRSFAHAELGLLQESLDDCQKAVALDPTNQAAVRTLDRAKSDLADR